MSNVKARNVIVVDTSAAFAENLHIRSIKYIGNTSGTAQIQEETNSGAVLWQESGTSNVFNPDVHLILPKGAYVTVTNSAKVYLYLK